MKKVIVILLCSIFTVNLAFCSDIVITKNSKRLEVKIVEIVDKGVRVKKLNNLDGPTYLIPKADVVTVIFENGTVKQFNNVEEETIFQDDASDYNSNNTNNFSNQRNDYYGGNNTSTSLSNQRNDYYNGNKTMAGFIDKRDNVYYLGNKRMNETEYLNFIQNNCLEAWQSYQKGRKLWRAGWGLLGPGLGVTAAGIVGLVLSNKSEESLTFYSNGSFSYSGEEYEEGFWYPFGLACTITGAVLDVAAIPCLVIGGIKKNSSHKVYNNHCASSRQMAVTFGIGVSSNGIGLAMNF